MTTHGHIETLHNVQPPQFVPCESQKAQTYTTVNPASRRARAVPPEADKRKPLRVSPCARSTRPVLSETDRSAVRIAIAHRVRCGQSWFLACGITQCGARLFSNGHKRPRGSKRGNETVRQPKPQFEAVTRRTEKTKNQKKTKKNEPQRPTWAGRCAGNGVHALLTNFYFWAFLDKYRYPSILRAHARPCQRDRIICHALFGSRKRFVPPKAILAVALAA